MRNVFLLGKFFILALLVFGAWTGNMPKWAEITIYTQQILAFGAVAVAYWAVRDDRSIIYNASKHSKQTAINAIHRLGGLAGSKLYAYLVPMTVATVLLALNDYYALAGLHVFGTLCCLYYRSMSIEIIKLIKDAANAQRKSPNSKR